MRAGACLAILVAACGGGGDDGQNFSSVGGPYFTQPMFFNRDVSGEPKAGNSGAIISALRAAGGWGNGDTMQIDFSIDVLGADGATPTKMFTPTDDFYSPDCDNVPMPVPTGGNVEG